MNLAKLNNWLISNNYDCQAVEGIDFSYLSDIDNDIITVSDCINFDGDIIDLCDSLGVNLTETTFNVFCFLHELGHIETADNYSAIRISITYSIIDFLYTFKFLQKYLDRIYHRLDFELSATEWACSYMINNKKEVKKLEKLFL